MKTKPTRPAATAAWAVAALALGACSSPRQRAEEHLAAGDAHLAQNELALAREEYGRALEQLPELATARLRLGAVALAEGDLDEAVAVFERLLESDPGNAEALGLWGEALLRLGRLEEADAKLRRALELAPESAQSWRDRGRLLLTMGQPEQAAQHLERAYQLAPRPSPDLLLYWGLALQQAGRDEEAVPRYEAALQLAPRDARVLNNLGLLLVQRDELERGTELLEVALSLRPGDPDVLANLGSAYLAQDRPDEARDLLQRALLAAAPGDPAREETARQLRRAEQRLPRATARPGLPNILLVVIDTLRADHVGAYGYPRNTTPRIDALAQHGVVFEQAISQAPWTAASVATLLTGLYPSVHGVDRGAVWGVAPAARSGQLPFAVQRMLAPGHETLAELLRAQGYRTAAFVSNVMVNSIFGFAQGFDHYDDEHSDYSSQVLKAKRRGDDTNRALFEWLDSGLEEPFFVLLHYNEPHWPYSPPESFAAEWVDGYRGALTPDATTDIVNTRGQPVTVSAEDLAYIVGLYDGEIRYADHNLGQVLDRLEEAGLTRPLMSIVTSDHGEELLDHGSTSHGFTLYDEQIRVPLLIHWPGQIAPRRVSGQAGLVDVLPTLMELIGSRAGPDRFQGHSLVAAIEGRPGPDRHAYAEASYEGDLRAVRGADGWKRIEIPSEGRALLFDLATDPGEQTDRAAGGGADAGRLAAELDAWAAANAQQRSSLNAATGGAPEVSLDAQTQDRLRALGYIQ